jgi:hypothetical protein
MHLHSGQARGEVAVDLDDLEVFDLVGEAMRESTLSRPDLDDEIVF